MFLKAMNFLPFEQKQKLYVKFLLVVSLVALYLFMPEFAFAGYEVTEITNEFDEGEEPVGTVAAASAEMLVIRRIWRIIKSSI